MLFRGRGTHLIACSSEWMARSLRRSVITHIVSLEAYESGVADHDGLRERLLFITFTLHALFLLSQQI